MVRLSMEPAVPDAWRHLYLEPDDPREIQGVPMLRTVQWSTRPYLARTDWLERIHEVYVGDGAAAFRGDGPPRGPIQRVPRSRRGGVARGGDCGRTRRPAT